MFTKRHRITLLFNANKAYDRQVVEGVGEYLQASQSEWDIFIEEDFRARIDKIKDWLGMASLPTSTTNRSSKRWLMSTSPLLGLAARITLQKVTHPFITLPPITMRWLKAHFCI